MGTEVAISFTTLRAQLESEKSSLFKIDENIKKIVQTTTRFPNDRLNSSGEYQRGNNNRPGGRNPYGDSGNSFNNDHFGKRKQETKTVFSRVSGRTADSDGEEEAGGKRARVPSAVSRELPTRAAALRAQAPDEQARTRNKRMFGSLLGTLHKFRQEEIVLQTKEEKKAQVERKIEEQARLEKEREQKERKTLFAEREHKRATIKALEAKMARVQEFDRWEESQKSLGSFILTRTRPHMYWLPKKMNDKAEEKLISSRKYHEKCMSKKRQELQEELQRIEQRCLRQRGPGAKENDPETLAHKAHENNGQEFKGESGQNEEERGRKRDKFATDMDKDDSDNDDHHDDVELKQESDKAKETTETVTTQADESKMDTSAQSTECDIPPVPGEEADVTMASVSTLEAEPASTLEAPVSTLEAPVSTLEAPVSTLEGSVSTLDAASNPEPAESQGTEPAEASQHSPKL